ncbi:hypothetical protein V6N13_135020 [Hibiscus sabdariffa]|uniref:Uncharacterized protein n=1 Tax=Hibiscus sabdariffa TaxID=183260 RepID=A0ABR2R5Y2_9ROSI
MESLINSTVIRRKPAKTRYQQCKQAGLCTRALAGQQKSMKFACSETTLCSNINLEMKDGTPETYCNSAQGFGYVIVGQDKGYILTDHNENTELVECIEDRIIHTELSGPI